MKKKIFKVICGCFVVTQILSVNLGANEDVSISDLKEITYYLMEDIKKQKEDLKKMTDLVKKDILPVNDGFSNYKISEKLLNYVNENK